MQLTWTQPEGSTMEWSCLATWAYEELSISMYVLRAVTGPSTSQSWENDIQY